MTEGWTRKVGSEEVGADDMLVAGVAAANAKVDEEGTELEDAEEAEWLRLVEEEAIDLERSV